MVNPRKCSGITPLTKRPCNRIPCFSYWTYGEWSQVLQKLETKKNFLLNGIYCSVLKAAAKDYRIARLTAHHLMQNIFTRAGRHLHLRKCAFATVTQDGAILLAGNESLNLVLKTNPTFVH
jgi:hypothetical protein